MSKKYKNIFNRYSTNQATPVEEKAINLFFDGLQDTSKIEAASEITPETGQLLLKKIEANIVSRDRTPRYLMAACAAAVLLILSAILFNQMVTPAAHQTITVAALPGVQKKIVLPDASVVYLNSGSSISYPAAFGKESREVTLKGEAYFEVEHKEEHPFIISSDHLKTRVLGTRFVVSNYSGDTPAVTVVSGRVMVTDRKSSASEIITRGQRVVYNPKNKLLVKHTDINAADYLAWKEGRIYFDHCTISQVLQTLHRRYNIALQLTTPAYDCNTISGTFPGNDIEKVLSSIRFINDMEYTKQQNDTIKITLKPCKN